MIHKSTAQKMLYFHLELYYIFPKLFHVHILYKHGVREVQNKNTKTKSKEDSRMYCMSVNIVWFSHVVMMFV